MKSSFVGVIFSSLYYCNKFLTGVLFLTVLFKARVRSPQCGIRSNSSVSCLTAWPNTLFLRKQTTWHSLNAQGSLSPLSLLLLLFLGQNISSPSYLLSSGNIQSLSFSVPLSHKLMQEVTLEAFITGPVQTVTASTACVQQYCCNCFLSLFLAFNFIHTCPHFIHLWQEQM